MISSVESINNVNTLVFNNQEMTVLFEDGRRLSVPLWWYPRLARAEPKQREHWEFCAGKRGIHWPEIDEDLSIQGILEGRKAPDAVQTLQ